MAGNTSVPIEYWPCAVGSILKCLQLQGERGEREGGERGRKMENDI